MRISKRWRNAIARMATGLALISASLAVGSSAALAGATHPSSTSSITSRSIAEQPMTGRLWTVVNSPGYLDSSPNPSFQTSAKVSNGTQLILGCYLYGAPAGPYGNTLWYQLQFNLWINDHYLNTPGTAAKPEPQTQHCGGAGTDGVSDPYAPQVKAINNPAYWGNSPTFARDVSGVRITNGDTIQLGCYNYGAKTGPYGNYLWYYAYDSVNHTYGYINDHYLNTTDTANEPDPLTGRC